MTALAWDQVGERSFQAGVDRGVLYLPSSAVVWNGLISVEEEFNRDTNPYYQDGVKFLDLEVLGEFAGALNAFTYPDEFEQCVGVVANSSGLSFHDQRANPFGLSYRTRLGDDVAGLDAGYEIHLLYNLRATPDKQSYSTVEAEVTPTDFTWNLTSTPVVITGRRPTAHISAKTTTADPSDILALEAILYGTSGTAPHLPSLAELAGIFP